MIYRLKNLNRMLVICVLYFVAYWNILVALLCSSKPTSNPYINLGVWNLGIYRLELVYEEPRFMCEVQISPNTFVPIIELGLEGSIYSLFCDCCTFGRSSSKSYLCSFASYWAWNYGSFFGHLWYSYAFDLFSCFGEIYGLGLDLGDINFSFYLYCCCCFFLSNFIACWGLTLPLIIVSSCLLATLA